MDFSKLLSRQGFLAVICISLLIHLIVGVFYGGYVLFEKYVPPEPELTAPPIPKGIEPRKKEYKIKMEKSQKQSSAPLPIPIVANIPSNVSLENIDLNVSSPRSDSKIRGVGSGDGVGKGFGNGFGMGSGFSEIEFFGIKGGGQNIAFVIDYSGSMAGPKEVILRRESMRVFEELPDGVNFAAIFFAGPAWPADKDWTSGINNWVYTDGANRYGTWRPKNWSKLPKVYYNKASSSSRRRYMRYAEDTPLVGGTVFDVPIYMALTLDPPPDTIFFMTDGACSRDRGINQIRKMLSQLRQKGVSVPVIHTVGMGIPNSGHLKSIAQLTGGTTKFLTPAQYEKKYGKGRVKLPGKGPNSLKLAQATASDKYPIKFNFDDK